MPASNANFIWPFCQCGNLIFSRDVCHVGSKVVLNVRNENWVVTNITQNWKIKVKVFAFNINCTFLFPHKIFSRATKAFNLG